MASDMSDGSVFGLDDESDGYVPEVKPKAPAPKKAAAGRPAQKKNLVQSTLKTTKAAPKKRPVVESDHDTTVGDESGFSNTPPSAKKQKKNPPPKKSSGIPLAELENDSLMPDTPEKVAPKGKKTATEMYQKLSQIEHIIKRPDTYIGSVERTEQQMWTFNKETGLMEYRNINFVPGLYKIFDEILVNAADNKQRDGSMTHMKITIDRSAGEITVENNGKGIPVEIHEVEKIYIPELIFGHLLAGSNFDDDEKKTVGGRNGYGAKLCNVFSTEFTLECQDSVNAKRYKQTWTENMQKKGKAKITSNKTADFTRVTFKPDFQRFGMPDGIDDDLEALLYRRVYDMAGTVRGVKVYLNGELLKLKDFKSYCDLYAKSIAKERSLEEGGEPTCTVEIDKDKGHPRWEVGFAVSDGTFQQVSFANSIATTSGGTHVNYIADQITADLLKTLTKRKKGHSMKQNQLKNHIFIFVNCFITNPAFTSQTKEQMTTKPSAFGSKCVLGEDFLKKIRKSEAIQNILDAADRKADKLMAKSDGSKRSRVSNAKLVEANLAGTRKGHLCTLILTEGDSAKAMAVTGRAILNPDLIGVFPLRGKLLNVRDASIDQITKNQEIQNIKQFLGLKHKQVYEDVKGLRYGKLMIMADQDHDGSHIKGLLINFLQVQFPSLLKIPGFFQEFITPIVKVWQGPDPKLPLKSKFFFTQPEYETWKEENAGQLSRWDAKYLKGLGTSTSADAKVYFRNLDEHLKQFEVMKPEEAEMFDLVFSKKKADARKEWLGDFVPGTYLDHSTKAITYDNFVNRELILFSMADNMRSIPSVLDGFKPGQRKVMFGAFKRNQVKDKKVVDLAGYVMGQTAYHHGDQSMNQTIIGLAQTFVGSNNVNCLEPSGNFGSRLQGGSDAASARYIYTRLTPFARKIFSKMDEPNLVTQYDEGAPIEPEVYYPVIPMVLVNGADGIGTGWSTSIPNYHPIEIVKNLKRRMGRLDEDDEEEKPFEPMMPWFRGWKGNPEMAGPDRYKFNGIAYQSPSDPNEVVISELPIRLWTDDFKGRLEKVISGVDGPTWIKDYKEFNDENTVHFEIQVDEKHMPKILEEGLLERFKLTKQVATSNLVAFNARGQIRKYEKVEDIMEEYYGHRFVMYTKRKEHWLKVFHAEFRKLSNQARFIKEIIDGELVVGRKKKDVLVQELRSRKYEAFPRGADAKKPSTDDEINEDANEDEVGEGGARDYDYLLSMPLWSLTLERLEKLKQAIANKKQEHDDLERKSEKDLWCDDLDAFEEEWEAVLEAEAKAARKDRLSGRRESKKLGTGGGSRSKKAKADDDYEPEKKTKAKPKAAAVKVEKSAQKFAEKFGAKPKVKRETSEVPEPRVVEVKDDDFSEDDFSALSRAKPTAAASKTSQISGVSQAPAEAAVDAGRSKRAAAPKSAKAFLIDSDSEGDDMLGDVGAMVKGIGKEESDNPGRLSLYAMNRPQSSHGNGSDSLPKLKNKASKKFDVDTADDTNYELLANSSPYKATSKDSKLVDDLLSDDQESPAPAPAIKASVRAAAAAPAEPKKRGRPAAAPKAKAASKPKAAPKSTALSPAAKAYAAKKKTVQEATDDEMAEASSPPPRPAARARPGRAAAAKRPVVVDEDSSMGMTDEEEEEEEEEEESDDPFDMDDD